MTERTKQRKTRVGRVVSDAMDKTVVVAIERRVQHPLYHKSVRRVRKFKAHDEANQYHVGDTVRLVETRPLSRTKRWRVAELLYRQDVPEVAPAVAAALPEEPVAEAVVAPVIAAEAVALADEPAAVAEESGEAEAAVEEPEAVAEESGDAEAAVEEPEAVAEESGDAEAVVEEPEAVAEESGDAEAVVEEPEASTEGEAKDEERKP